MDWRQGTQLGATIMIYLYRVWADNTKSFIGLYTKSKADTYMNEVGGTFECIPVKVVQAKRNAA